MKMPEITLKIRSEWSAQYNVEQVAFMYQRNRRGLPTIIDATSREKCAENILILSEDGQKANRNG